MQDIPAHMIPGSGKKRAKPKNAPEPGTPAATAAARRPYYKLAKFDQCIGTFRDGRRFETEAAARAAAAKAPGYYRISRVEGGTRQDGEPFTVGAS